MVQHFAGTPTSFLGMLKGRQLAQAYASADIFVMPSESETLGERLEWGVRVGRVDPGVVLLARR